MKPKEIARAKSLSEKLVAYDATTKSLPGIRDAKALEVFIEQLIESLRRIEFAKHLRTAKLDPRRVDPKSDLFDPLRAAVLYSNKGEVDEAAWLVFLFVHFGKHADDGYRLIRDIYGALGAQPWTWKRVSQNPASFRKWLSDNESNFKNDGVSRRFGNHRKYETLSTQSDKGTATVVESYVKWIGGSKSFAQKIRDVQKLAGQNPREVFNYLYRDMNSVQRFGRLGKFDFLTMLDKLGIAPIEADSAYLKEATGPRRGAKLMFGGDVEANISGTKLDEQLDHLDAALNVGMQALEDSLCNWQKSPTKFISFKG